MSREKLRDAAVLIMIVAAVAGGSMAVLRGLPFLASIERWIADYRIATLTPPEPQHPDIVFPSGPLDACRVRAAFFGPLSNLFVIRRGARLRGPSRGTRAG